MNLKRALAMVLCLCMVAACLPVMDLIPEAKAATEQTVRIEAENAECNVFANKADAYASASGGVMVGGAPDSRIYPTWDNGTEKDWQSGFIDKSNNPYVVFYVDASAAGTYKLVTAGRIRLKTKCDNAYAVILVNPSRKLEDASATVAYQAHYGAVETAAVYGATEAVEVQLVEGRNVIFVSPLSYEQDVNWATVDYLDITGPGAVTHVVAGSYTLYTGNAPYVYGFDTVTANGGLAGGSWGNISGGDKTVAISEMSRSNAHLYRGFTYTVNAPEDGYYDITVTHTGIGTDTRPFGFLVDGDVQYREFVHNSVGDTDVRKNPGSIDFSVYLTKGDHILTFTAPANRTESGTANQDWCNFNELKLYGGLTQSVIQGSINGTYWYAEAEYTAEGYTVAHNLPNVETNHNNTFRDYNNANYSAYQAKRALGGGSIAGNYTLAQLQEGRLDKTTTTGVTIYVEAKTAGSYDFYSYYRMNCPGIWGTMTPYGVFMVNGEFGAKADFLASGSDWSYNTATVQLALEKGLNEITFIPMTKDQYVSGTDWASVDCIFVDTDLQVVKVPTGSNTYTVDQGTVNLYTQVSNNYAAYDKREAAKALKITATNLTKDTLYAVPFVGYTVEAPYDGFYNISIPYDTAAASPITAQDWAIVVLVDDGTRKEIKHLATDRDGTADISTYLTAGTHTLAITLTLPITADASDWCNLGPITMNGGLTLAAEQVHPLKYGKTVLEAETDGLLNYFDTSKTVIQTREVSGLQLASGGKEVGYAKTGALSTADVKAYMDVSNQSFVEFIVDAEAAGEYTLSVGVRGVFTTSSYILVQVNGTMYQQDCFFDAQQNGFQPITVTLAEGRNIVRCLSAAKDMGWVNLDCLILPSGVTGISNTTEPVKQMSAALDYTGNYNNRDIGAANDRLDNCIVADVSLEQLSLSNFRQTSWYSVTVNAPAAGYYPVRAYLVIPPQGETVLAKIGVLANGESYPATLRQAADTINAMAEAFVYLKEGINDLVFTGILSDSGLLPYINADEKAEYWMDAEFVYLGGGLTMAETQRHPVKGLVDGSVYTKIGSTVYVPEGTGSSAINSNFYDGNRVYTVVEITKGDVNNDGKIDIRDLKVAQEHVLKGNATNEQQAITDIVHNNKADAADVTEYKNVIFGKGTFDLAYQPNSIGAAEILKLGNPVGRLLNHRSAVFMESSASGFALTGDLKGDVTISLRAEQGKSDGKIACIYVEVDGELYKEYAFAVNTDQTITIVEDLPAGNHTIKITKGTDAKYDMLYVYSVGFNGTLTATEAADCAIEFLGDSITVGYGLYEADVSKKNAMSGSYYSYANVAADLLGADHYTVGNGAWRFGKNTGAAGDTRYLGYIYEKNSMNLDLGAYDFAWQPEFIVINLGTNDANQYDITDLTDEQIQETFNADVAELLTMVRAHNPNATIFWVYGAMENVTTKISKEKMVPMLQAAIDAYETATGDVVTYVHVTNDTSGVYDHPTREGHIVIGNELVNAISKQVTAAIAN